MGDEPRKILPFYAVRLKHLVTPRVMLEVTCRACRQRNERLDSVAIAFLAGPETYIGQLEPRLRCQTCGRKGFASVGIAEWL